MTNQSLAKANNLEAFWMPFTANKAFKADPRLISRAQGMYYYTNEGREVLDSASGLWCCNAGHAHPKIVEAIRAKAGEVDYVPHFQMGHPESFALAARIANMLPGSLDHVFFTNSGSEACDTALKIAIAYHRMNGEGTRTRLIGRERGYHGTGFGGISVGGMPNNRKFFGSLLPGTDHLPHTHNIEQNAYSRGQPAWGAHLADELENLVALHDASTIAAVIVEPIAGSTGVLIPPQGYLERIREICTRHGILMILDEVVTAFGRLGAGSASERLGVEPDLMCMAKGLTSGSVPMGAVGVQKYIYDCFINNTESGVELFHGYTYSGHPLAAAAGLAALEVYQEGGLFERAREMESYFEEAMHSLKGEKHVIDVRNLGMMAGVELAPREGAPLKRAYEVFLNAYERGVFLRLNGEIFAIAPPLITDKSHIDQIVDVLRQSLKAID
ncbi:MAG: aspartate aminotransferase family protein [Alphaproteobacteria bacterium]|nr:MAG: aspartate aminotransferase family protein [Alphaproteobacteria bacterium]